MIFKNKFNKSPGIFTKFTIAFILVGLIPLMLISFISLSTLTKQVETHTFNNYEDMLKYSSNRIQNMYDEYNNISKLMYRYNMPEFGRMQELVDREDKIGSYQTERAIDDFLRTILNVDHNIESVFFIPTFDKETRYYNRHTHQFIRSKFTLFEDHETEILNAFTHLTLIPVHKDDYFNNSTDYVLTYARNLLNTDKIVSEDSQVLGTLLFDVNIQAFEDIFSDLELKSQDDVYVIDEDGFCIYSSHEEHIGKRMKTADLSGAEDYMQFEEMVEELGWRVIAKIEKQSIFDNLVHTKTMIQMVIFISIIALLIFAFLFSRQFSQPIYKMVNLMKKVESKKLNLKMNIDRKDEIGVLANGFDQMIDNLNSYIKKVYVAELGQRQAQLDALRSQINPHYLYNTLEVIRMTAVQNEDNKVADMIHYLSLQLKYVMDQSDSYVSLEKEIDHVRSYLELIKVRYEDKIDFDILMDETLANHRVPKLSIQPLVENAVIHGLKPKSTNGNILIRCQEYSEEVLCIEIIDDGIGMDEGTLEKLKESIYGDIITAEKQSIGLRNVHDRLRGRYGEPYGIEVTSKLNLGTMVKLIAPIRVDKDA